MKKYTKTLVMALLLTTCILLTACGVINVSGKTFRFSKVTIDWGLAEEENKQSIFQEYQVKNETELLNVLKTKNNRNSRFTTFGTDKKYVTKNTENEILDSGFYRQDESLITLSETEEGLNAEGAYTLQANDKGYVVTIKINDEFKIFAKYQYVEQD